MLSIKFPIFLNSNLQVQDQGGVVLMDLWKVSGGVVDVREWGEYVCGLVNGDGVGGGVFVKAEVGVHGGDDLKVRDEIFEGGGVSIPVMKRGRGRPRKVVR